MKQLFSAVFIFMVYLTGLQGQPFNVSLSLNPAGAGITTGEGSYDLDALVTVTATPNAGFRFVNWTENSEEASPLASFSFNITSDRNLVANFIQTYTVTASSSPTTGGNVTGTGTYDAGTSVTVTAVPSSGYRFVNWTIGGNQVSTNTSYNFNIESDLNLVANFIQIYTVATSSSPVSGGNTTGTGTYDSGTSVTITATPLIGYRFVNWTEGGTLLSTNSSFTFNINSNRIFVANFEILTYSISTKALPAAGGSTSGDGTYNHGSTATVIASSNSGYRFTNWTNGTTPVSTNANYSFTVTSDATLTANFIRVFTVSTSSSPSNGGTTSGGGTYDTGSSATVIATPNSGYRFVSWTEGGTVQSTNATYTFTVNNTRTLVANFIQVFTVATSSVPTSGGTTTGSGSYDIGSTATVDAFPNSGYKFVNWTENTTVISTDASYSFTVNSSRTLVANFIQVFTVTTSVNPAAGGTTSGGGTYDFNASVSVSAVPAANYRFINWTESGVSVSTSATYTFSATSNRTLVANFAIITYTVGASASPAAGGTTSGGGTYNSGSSATVVASPSTNYKFINWTEGGLSVSTDPSYTFTVSGNRTLVANFAIITYTVSASASPAGGGTVSGSGTYDSGSSVTVTAVPSAGYRFVNWTEGSVPVSTNTGYTFTISGNRTLVANFIKTFTVSLSPNPAAGGNTTGGGTFDTGSAITITATPSAGYRFVNWTEGGISVSTNASYSFTVTSNRTFVGNFVQVFTVTTASNPGGGGSTSGGGSYDSGSTATVTATPAAGYRFVNWTEGGTPLSTNASYSFTVTSTRNLTANFLQTYTVAVSASPPAGGTLSGGGTYDTGAPVTVVATPSSGYRFVNWTEGGSSVSSNASYTFSATANRTLVANFIQTFTVSTSSNPAAGGSTSGGGIYNSGTSVTVTATPASGYRFVNWTESGSIVSTSASYNFNAAANRTLVANFVLIYTISTSSNPAAGGTTTGNGTYDSGASATVTATPATGYRFVNWTESGVVVSTNASYTFTVTAARTLVGNFIRIYNVSTSSSPVSGGTTSGGGTYDTGSSVTVVAIPSAGYRFVNWTESGIAVSASTSYTFVAGSDRTLVANFIQTFTVSISANPTGSGSISGGGTFDSGTSVTVSATPLTGYRFSGWTEAGTIVSTSSSYTFNLTGNRTLTANFIRIYTISVSSSPSAGGTNAGSGTYDSGASATVTATPVNGYRFTNWTEGGVIVSSNAAYTFTVTASRTLVANFIQIYTVTASSSPAAGGTTSGSGIYDSGSSVTVIATPSAGYRFVNWTENGTSVSTSTSFSFTATVNRSLIANFIQIFTINTSSNPADGGTTSGGGTFDTGTSATLTASPATGFRFVSWTEGGTIVSTSAGYTFTVNSSRTLVANFIRTYSVSTTSSPSVGGTTSGAGTFDNGTSVTILATSVTGYRFVSWTESGTVVSSNTSYTFVLSSDRILVANFIQVFTISGSVNPAAGGTISGTGTYDLGTSVTLLATPSAGYRFNNWTEGGTSVSTNASYTFSVSSARILVANFIQVFAVSASANPASGGTTSGGGTFDTGTSVTVIATPSTGYRFNNWTEAGVAISTNASYTFTLTAARTLIANFVQTFQVTTSADPAAGGTTTGSGTYDSGSSVTVSATPASGFRFANWTEAGAIVSTSTSYSIQVTSARNLVANFIRIYTVATSSNPTAGGSTTGSGTYDTGTSVTVNAEPASGFRFVNWTENGTVVSLNSSYTFAENSNHTLVANFIHIFTVTTSPNPAAGGTTTGNGTYDSGSSVTVGATPLAGYRFVNWTEGGNPVSASSNYTFAISANRTLSANFIRIYSVTVSANPAAGGSVAGGGTYDAGTSVEVVATPVLGYAFSAWSEGGSVVSSNDRYTFTIDGNRNLVAGFSLIPVVFNLSQPDGEIINNDDTLSIDQSDAGSLTINVESNFDWTVTENSLWLSVDIENGTTIKVTYLENISVIDKTAPIFIKNQLDDELKVNIKQKGRISSLKIDKFEGTIMYPNPAGDFVSFRLGEGEFKKIRVVITSIQGNILSGSEYKDIMGNEIIKVNLASLPSGQYLISIGDDTSGRTFRLIKY